MNLIITGAGGFVGQNLLPLIVTQKKANLFLVEKDRLPEGQLAHLAKGGSQLTAFASDRIPPGKELDSADAVICLAGSTSVDAALEQPAAAIEGNLEIAVDLAEYVRVRNPRARVIYVSSDEVLGESYVPLSEDAPLAPTQPYAASKAASEVILHNYRDTYGLNIVTLRSCNLVGPRQKVPKLIPTVVSSLALNKPVPVHGDGRQSREWMAVHDLCRAIILLLDESAPVGVYHATSGVSSSVNEVIALVAHALELPLNVCEVADRLIQDKSYSMSAERIKSLGWSCTVDPREAISRAAISLLHEFKSNPARD